MFRRGIPAYCNLCGKRVRPPGRWRKRHKCKGAKKKKVTK